MSLAPQRIPARSGDDASGALNACVDLLESNLAAGRADRPYLVTPERTWSYGEVAASSDAAGAGLLDLGLGAGDRVLVATRDRPEFVVTFWGAIKAGLVPVPIAQGLASSDVHFIATDSEARAVVCDPSTAAQVLPAAEEAGVAALLVDDSRRDGALLWSEVCGRPASLEAAPTTSDDIALWLYTSGTTGLPKAVTHRHANLAAAPAGLFAQVLEVGPDDVVLSASRMFFAYGLGNSVYLPAAAGAAVIVEGGPIVPARMVEVVGERRPTVLFGVPAFFEGVARLGNAELPSSLRAVVSAGEALPASLFERFERRFGLPLLDGLGSTEALHHITSNRPGDTVPGSAGPPLEGWEVQVRDRDGLPLEEGSSGELWVRGPTTFSGYWKRPELTLRMRDGEWIRTGDQVRVVDGRVWHEGRVDDLIKLGGVWVAPVEIEEVLRSHPNVSDAAVVSVDDGSGIAQLRAFVTGPRDGSGIAAELRTLCRERLARFKVPTSFEVVSELPRTPTGKLKRYLLRQQPE